MIEKLTKQTDPLRTDSMQYDPLKNDALGKAAGKEVDHFYDDWGVALNPQERAASEQYQKAVGEAAGKQEAALGEYKTGFQREFGAADRQARGLLASAQQQSQIKVVPFSVWSDGWGQLEQTYYVPEDAAKQIMADVNKEKKGLVAEWEGGYRINSKGYGADIHKALSDAQQQTQKAQAARNTQVQGMADAVGIQRESALNTYEGNVNLANQAISATKAKWTTHLQDMQVAFKAGVAGNATGIQSLVQSGALVFKGNVK